MDQNLRCLPDRAVSIGCVAMTGVGHEERSPPVTLNAGFGIAKETFAVACAFGRDAPKPVIPRASPPCANRLRAGTRAEAGLQRGGDPG